MSTVLIVDNDDAIIGEFAGALRRQKPEHKVVTAQTCAEARRMASAHPPAVLVTNFWLSDGNGIDLQKELLIDYYGLQTIMTSAFWPPDKRREAETRCAFKLYDKPIDEKALLRSIEEAVIIHRALHAGKDEFRAADVDSVSDARGGAAPDIESVFRHLKKVLIVDDSSLHANMCATLFAPYENCELIFAGTGFEALERLEEDSLVDLIITDINMPDMNGIALLEALQARNYGHLPVIVVSTEDKEADIMKALKIGARGYATKPWRISHFRELIARVLSKGDSDRQNSAPVATFNDYQEKKITGK